MKKSKTYRELQFENEHVCVWKTLISPNQPLDTQSYQLGHIVVDSKKAYWIDTNSNPEVHPPQNLTNESTEVMVIEMKKLKDHPLPSIPLD
ncbi:MAG: hypothetical protein S4CHLAM123_01570 [Chlamydiales bacterium]|nr:hypothetical protein [Chlamydiales bacterium]